MGNVEARFLVKNFVLDEVIGGTKTTEVRPLAPHVVIPHAGDNLFFSDQKRRVKTQVTGFNVFNNLSELLDMIDATKVYPGITKDGLCMAMTALYPMYILRKTMIAVDFRKI